ncbi:MAG: glycoside hydrolase family 3 protein [Candidatus Aminicenantes bacterium]|nr:glycoside hydrolase family 3 protein [Candidatus Aminicenantes bacterium]
MTKGLKFCFLVVLVLFFGTKKIDHPKSSPDSGLSEARWVRKTIEKMTLEEKVGQMLCLGFYGDFINENSETWIKYRHWVEELKIGGLAIYRGDVYETAHMMNSLQASADIPLLIAANLERGLGSQMEGATHFPPIMSIGATGSEELSYQMGRITALEARAVGIHMAYFPVVDVNINPVNPIINTRSFGENPVDVGRLAAAYIKGCQEYGLIATAKHFPGHGDTELDSHNDLATVLADMNRLTNVELYPFQKAIDAGVQAVMSAHISIPAIDPTPNLPATLSKPIMTDYLRDKLGFKGLIVSDSMGMGGITSLYPQDQAAVLAVKAGVDIILLTPEPEIVLSALIDAVNNGQISEARIDESVNRILQAKARMGLQKDRYSAVHTLDQVLATETHLQWADSMLEQSMTLVKDTSQILPLTPEKKIAVFSLSSDPDDYYAGRPFIREIKKRDPKAFEFYAEASTGTEYFESALQTAGDVDVLVIALFSSLRSGKGSIGLNERQVNFIHKIVEKKIPVLVISFGSPYYLRHFPDVNAYLCAYWPSPQAQEMAAKAAFGEIDIRGKLPVSIPECFPLGHGIQLSKVVDNQ